MSKPNGTQPRDILARAWWNSLDRQEQERVIDWCNHNTPPPEWLPEYNALDYAYLEMPKQKTLIHLDNEPRFEKV